MTGDALRQLAAQATPGPWVPLRDGDVLTVCTYDFGEEVLPWNEGVNQVREPDARLIALAPDLAVLLADAMDALGMCHTGMGNIVCSRGGIGCSVYHDYLDPLLARFAEIEARAKGEA